YDAGHGLDVRPHPHIGLATVTYLFEGEIMHKDTLGSDQPIRPGAVNWMTAGRGISHSERTGADERGRPHAVHGLQSWIALPKEYEEATPEFFHHGAATIPELTLRGVRLRVVAGEAYGMTAPTKIHSPLFYVEAHMDAGSTLELPPQYRERGAYVISGDVRVGGDPVTPQTLPVFLPQGPVRIEAVTAAHIMLLGGDPLPEKRFIWWNFVSTSQERIEQAKEDWAKGRFGTIPGDSLEFVPLPPDKKS
ncbi:MAG: pirin family protein, partial [Alphaproteobacteria bacterium]|nr:pirin family protein [Alphaproteobacteria bacterium]